MIYDAMQQLSRLDRLPEPMIEPRLNYVSCPGLAASSTPATWNDSPPAADSGQMPSHRMAYWEWNGTGNPDHPHVVLCVHGLTRQGRDFDTLARALCRHVRVICPDVVGRGHSDWLADASGYQIPVYAGDMLALLAHLHQQAPLETLDWVGTSMGGLIGMAVCGHSDLPLPVPVRRLVLNDVGPALEWDALERIGQYLGAPVRFASVEEGAAALWTTSSSFGPHTPDQWLELSRPMLRRPADSDSWVMHYDPALAGPFRSLQREAAQESEAQLWQLYDQITARTLVLRGAESDLLSPATAQAMAQRGPKAQILEFAHVGHAPTLMADDQVAAVRDFLLGAPGSGAA